MLIVRWLIAILILPGTVLVVVPAAILWLSKRSGLVATPESWRFWLALFLGLLGVVFALWTMVLFFRFGNGKVQERPWTFRPWTFSLNLSQDRRAGR